MKILHEISFFAPEFGGSVLSVYNLAKKMAMRGHQITIITTDYHFNTEYAASLSKFGVQIIPFQCKLNITSFLFSPSMKKWLEDNIKQFDIVHLHNFRSYQNAVVCRYSKKYCVPTILAAHGDIPYFEKKILKILFDFFWGYNILKNCQKMIALTNIELIEYCKMGVSKGKIEIIPNSLDLSTLTNLPDHGLFRERFGISNEKKIILFLGRIHKIKGIDLLIDAFFEIHKERDNVLLVIVGPDDGYLNLLKKLQRNLNLGEEIIFTGPLFGKDKYSAFLDANVYVLPSIYEAFPNTVLEAWACKTPVIVTKSCTISNIVEGAGYVVDTNKYELKDTIIKILDNDRNIKIFQEKGEKMIKNDLNLDNCIIKIESLYASLLVQKIRNMKNKTI